MPQTFLKILYEINTEARDLNVDRVGELLPDSRRRQRGRSRGKAGIAFDHQHVEAGVQLGQPKGDRGPHDRAADHHHISLHRLAPFFCLDGLRVLGYDRKRDRTTRAGIVTAIRARNLEWKN